MKKIALIVSLLTLMAFVAVAMIQRGIASAAPAKEKVSPVAEEKGTPTKAKGAPASEKKGSPTKAKGAPAVEKKAEQATTEAPKK